jgi:Zn finger protein HypA/HybF involved in hydrogenase expression
MIGHNITFRRFAMASKIVRNENETTKKTIIQLELICRKCSSYLIRNGSKFKICPKCGIVPHEIKDLIEESSDREVGIKNNK